MDIGPRSTIGESSCVASCEPGQGTTRLMYGEIRKKIVVKMKVKFALLLES